MMIIMVPIMVPIMVAMVTVVTLVTVKLARRCIAVERSPVPR
ncbi:hypothetical protein [Ferrovum myxofaciens]|nr:hypothetical protein [Ferrovum myxofaciens]